MWRFDAMLPVDRAESVTLDEGGTPLLPLLSLGSMLGINALYAKDESRNPTGSFKDRLASCAISSARAMGARVIASRSSGNAGASAAAYAARAGLPCIVFTFEGTVGAMVTQMRAYGATVISTRSKTDRWKFLEQGVRELGWFPTSPFFGPAVGSNPLGIEGYKTIAYEIAESLDWRSPDWCILPVCYGDALIGIWKGFQEMLSWGWIDRVPRMVAAEIYGSLGAALEGNLSTPPAMPRPYDTVAVSIGAVQGTYQALDVVRKSGGTAVSVADQDMLRWQAQLAMHEGVYVEPAAAAPAAALENLRRHGIIGPPDSVVLLLTASGLKDPETASRVLGEIPRAKEDFQSVLSILKQHERFSAACLPVN
ncbi:MAG: pyridoxal-phosphate dependent enzyme [Burkholderiales bacterium]